LNLAELGRVSGLLDRSLRGARLRRVLQTDRLELVLVLETGGRAETRRKHPLLLSCRPRLGRISRLEAAPEASESIGAFTQFLRAHLVGARLERVRIAESDRIVTLRFQTRGPTEGTAREVVWELCLALMGARSNLYLLDAEGCVRMALRPLDETRRDLSLGAPWRDPERREAPQAEDRFSGTPDADLLEAVERFAVQRRGEGRSDEQVRRLKRLLRRRTATLERKASHLEEDLSAAAQARELERDGELLKLVLHRVRTGASEVQATDPATGETRTIALDPKLGPAANLDALFRRYRKALRRARRAGDELDGVQAQLDRARALGQQLDAIVEGGTDPGALDAFGAIPEVRRLLARAEPGRRPKSVPSSSRRRAAPGIPASLLPRRYRSSTGLEIWVGRSDLGNDALTTRLARGNDLFFHLDGSPGSHVVLRTEGRTDPPSEALLEACELAVHFSKHRGASRAGVHVAPIKQVRKPRGAKPGLVSVHGGRTISLRHDPGRLRRILEARIEEADQGHP
jgi:predicted ribosome quality control (RQC) complex YloA/Tae2 family protein